MAVVGQLMVVIAGNHAPLMASIASSQAGMKGLAATSSATFAAIRTAALGIGVGAIAGIGAGINAASNFQEQLAKVNTIAHLSPTALAGIGSELQALSAQTGIGLPELSQGLYDALSVGVPLANAMKFVGSSTQLAIGGLSTVPQAISAITTAVNAWSTANGSVQLSMKDSAAVMDIFATAIETGGMTAADLPGALATVASSAAIMNVPLQTVAATLATLTTRGETAATAATALDAFLNAVQRVPPGMAELQKATGKSYEQIARTKGPQAAMAALVTDAKRYGVAMIEVLGRQEALPLVGAFTGAGATVFEANLANAYDAAGTAAAQAGERMGTFDRQMMILGSSINNVAISIGTGLLPPLTSFVTQVSGAVQAAQAWAQANPQIASTILPVVAGVAAVVVAATSLGAIMGIVGTAIAVITSPILLVVGGIVALAAHFGMLGVSAQGAAYHIGATIGKLAQSFVEWIGPMIPKVLAQLQVWGGQIVSWIVGRAPAILAQLQTWAGAFVAWIQPMIGQALATLGQLAGQVGAWIGAQAPGWLAQLGKWAAAFVDWISPMIPKAIGALGALAGQGIAWVAAQAPTWLAALLRWADSFLAWIAPMIPKMLGALGELAGQLVSWVLQQIPVVALALGQLAIQFVQWVLPQIPVLLVSLGQLAIELLAWIARQIPVIALEVGKWAASLVGWVLGSIPGVLTNLGTWLLDVLAWFATVPAKLITAVTEFGATIGTAIVGGIGDIGGQIINSILGQSEQAATFIQQFQDKFGRLPTRLEHGQFTAGTLPGFATGGIVPGMTGTPMLATVHGGETITPAGRGQVIHLHHTTINKLDGREISRSVQTTLYDDAAQFSSGFARGELP